MSDDLPPEPTPPDPVPPEPNPDPVTMEELVEQLTRTADELAALDAAAYDPDARALEALKQHLHHERRIGSVAASPPDAPLPNAGLALAAETPAR